MDWIKDRQWSAIGQERERLAADLGTLTERDCRTQAQCGSWTVEETLAHLTAAASIGRWRWLRSIIGSRFNADLHNRRRLDEHLGGSPSTLHSCNPQPH
ncbi:maleylpyruvate isomerase N-terminal domain-containing protein [Cryobacterium luteum]|uniref:maleylpyruvate isomerase N-terminal domain-containing protein n=1 Tax=Cryobacterium luteum TaxID=1424661 RepID=UPI0008C1D515|nr:maleylpyruvate isomerase N-terminal domain-containing protein [Cryobacterium luteum]SEN06429.1 Mycothiol maleylpyruvate isomerase N-terminal domain-containing protein [Cryobacterium luteum]